VVKEVLTYSDPATGSEITIIPSDTYEVTTMVDFGTKVLGTQNATLKNISEFKEEISSARTFSFLHELEMLLDHGLIKGGDISNAIVYVDKDLTPETTEKLKKPLVKIMYRSDQTVFLIILTLIILTKLQDTNYLM
jgi:UDP-3-O-[3-hydroxymyristoyl] N-acetylglucosamine deacetylase/3-hydroxyacyl-[acyl-carrier-protein] dehydratase